MSSASPEGARKTRPRSAAGNDRYTDTQDTCSDSDATPTDRAARRSPRTSCSTLAATSRDDRFAGRKQQRDVNPTTRLLSREAVAQTIEDDGFL